MSAEENILENAHFSATAHDAFLDWTTFASMLRPYMSTKTSPWTLSPLPVPDSSVKCALPTEPDTLATEPEHRQVVALGALLAATPSHCQRRVLTPSGRWARPTECLCTQIDGGHHLWSCLQTHDPGCQSSRTAAVLIATTLTDHTRLAISALRHPPRFLPPKAVHAGPLAWDPRQRQHTHTHTHIPVPKACIRLIIGARDAA